MFICFVLVFLFIENIWIFYKRRIKIKKLFRCFFHKITKSNGPANSLKFIDEVGAWYTLKPLLILHGAGGWQGKQYNNSKEGILRGLELGYKVIEIDIGMTSDNEFVLTHRFQPDNEIIFDHRPTLKEFLNEGALEYETPMSLYDFVLTQKDSDCYFLLDCSHGIEEFVIDWIGNNCSEDFRKKLIFQVHSIGLLKKVSKSGFFNYIHYNNDLKDILSNLKILHKYNVHSCSVSDNEISVSNSDLNYVLESGIHVIAYSINHIRRYNKVMKIGVSGIFSDYLTPNDIKEE